MRIKIKRKGALVFCTVGLVISIIMIPSILKLGMVGICIVGILGALEKE